MEEKQITVKAETDREPEEAKGQVFFVRLNNSEKVQHIIFMVCFIVLVITGFMLKVPDEMVRRLGGIGETVFYYRSILHRSAGAIMILVSIYHIYYLLFKPAGRRWIIDMIPRPKDLKDMLDNMLYYLSVKDAPPEFDRFNYKHKMEYGALIVGTTIMSVTGLLLWSEYRWSKFFLDIAALVHRMEATLACLALIIWHLYDIHLKPHKFPIDNMWITGVIDEEEMKAEYPFHYKKIMQDPKLQEIYMIREDQKDAIIRSNQFRISPAPTKKLFKVK